MQLVQIRDHFWINEDTVLAVYLDTSVKDRVLYIDHLMGQQVIKEEIAGLWIAGVLRALGISFDVKE